MEDIMKYLFLGVALSLSLVAAPVPPESLNGSVVENCTAIKMDYFKCIDHLSKNKYSARHFIKIEQALKKKDEMIRVVTYNMLFDVYDHNLDFQNRWPQRHPRIKALMERVNPDIICTQELFGKQIEDMKQILCEEFKFYAGYGDPDGEQYGIFYRADRFDVLDSRSENPVTILKLKDLKTDKIMTLVNTHLAFGKIEKREAQVRKIMRLIKPLAKQGAVILTGDLNTFPSWIEQEGFPFYDGDNIHRLLTAKGILSDAKTEALIGHLGPTGSFTNDPNNPEDHSPFKGEGTPGVMLDHIYISRGMQSILHGTESGTIKGHYPSDHMPLICDLLIK
jgi:endonuclease/exonuclease/phosphatase family metal-dependent hydrolase